MDDKIRYIWDKFYDQLYKYINNKLNSEDDTEDILQNIFIKIYNNIESINDESKIKPWIYKITKNTIIDYYKKKKSIPMDIEQLDKYLYEETDCSNMNDEITRCFEKLIFELPSKYQQPLYLHDIKEKKHSEISKELDISVSCSKMRVVRARNLLKDSLLNCCDFEFDTFGNIIDFKSKGNSCKDNNCKEC